MELPEEEVPLTGDNSHLWAVSAITAGLGLVVLYVGSRKKEEEFTA